MLVIESLFINYFANLNHSIINAHMLTYDNIIIMSMYVCSQCGSRSPQKYAICPSCKGFNTMQLQDSKTSSSKSSKGLTPGAKINTKSGGHASKTFTVKELYKTNGELKREPTGITEFDRLMMGGMVDGQVILIGAEPGFGKSTLCIEVLAKLAEQGHPVLYASGEESERQIAQRAERLNIDTDNLHIMPTKTVEDVIATADNMHAYALVVDSLQTMGSNDVNGSAGGMAQSKEAAYAFTEWAKRTGARVILVSQFTKGDEVAGSNMIAHIVDTILIGDSDDNSPLKFLRSRKNRYGRTDEVAVFVHESDGLKSVSDPSGYLIGDDAKPMQGAAMSFCQDGIRLLPVEIDALVAMSAYNNPQRQFSGLDSTRGKILVAALGKYAGMMDIMAQCDVFTSTMNGMRLTDPLTDLAVVASIASSACNIEPLKRTAWFGEVALTGKIRGRSMMEARVREAARLGFERCVLPVHALKALDDKPSGIELTGIDSISEIKDLL